MAASCFSKGENTVRKLMWFTIGFTAACAAGVYLVSGFWLLGLGGFALAALIAALCIGSAYSKKAACALFGCLIGFLWFFGFDKLYLQPARQMEEQARFLQIEVTDYSRPTEKGIAATGKTELDGKTYQIQFYLNEPVTLSPGDRVEGGFVLRYTGGGGENSPTYHQGKGIFLLAYPKNAIEKQQLDAVPSRYLAPVLRQKILALLGGIFPADTAPFAKALLIGDTSDLSYETVTALKTSGVYHIVAVSGMHVSILFALVYMLCGKHRVFTAVFGIPVLCLFAAVAGFSPSIVRACVMQVLMIIALLTDKEYDPPTALAFAVLLLLASNPLCITSVSFQLSVGCIVGIFLFTRRIHDYLLKETPLGPAKGRSLRAKLTRWAVSSVSVTLGAISVTAPLCAVHFGSVSIIGILTNLLVLWFVSIIFYGIMAACLLGAIWLPLGIGISWVLSWPIRGILWVTDMISRVPVASVYTSSVYIVAWLIFAYILLSIFFKTKKKHPLVLTGCLLAGLVGAIAFSWIEPRLDNYRITAIDVGQGQCLLLQNEGKYYMVDCGGDSDEKAADEASKLLLSQGIFRLDGLIITHYDKDHAGGVDELLSRIPADKLYLPVFDDENPIRQELEEEYSEQIQWVNEDLVLDDGIITIYASQQTIDANESSLCILFQPEKCDILITGDRSFDGERELLERVTLPDLEILVAGHHGSKTSTSLELLKETCPELVLISVGADNRYGHPTQETLERLKIFGCLVYRTDLEGTIILRG